jgi:hypothetical protein
VRGYVTGDQFFGRGGELQQIADSIRQQEVVGVFGLRKTGKTSLLHELIRTRDSEIGPRGEQRLLVYQDLEYLPSLSEDPVPELIQDIAENLRRRLKKNGLRTQELAELPERATPTEFRRRLDLLLERLEGVASIVLILDEIEYLCPPNPGSDTSSEAFQRVRQLFGGLRKLVQERDNFGFLLAGLARTAIESPELFGAPNPLYSFARPLYLRPFTIEESGEMLNAVGRRVSLHWTPEAIAIAYEFSGGHALLLRELASHVLNDQRHARSNIAQIRAGDVHRVVPAWRQGVAGHVRDVLPHLRRYYGDDADLAVMLMDDPDSFGEYAAAYPDSTFRLQQLGIILNEEGIWRPSRLLEFSHSFESRPRVPTNEFDPALRPDADLAADEESETLEKKESLRSHSDAVPDEVIVDEVLGACLGFLNRQGGTVLVGITDDHRVVGIARDIKRCGSFDNLCLFLTSKIRDKIGTVGCDLVQISGPVVAQERILRLDVRAAPRPIFPIKAVGGNTGLFVRNNNTTQLLKDQQAIDYIDRHWKTKQTIV